VQASTADLQAAAENMRDVRVGLVAEVAATYLELRGHQARKSVAERNLKSQQDTLELTRSRQAAGVANDLDVARAEAQAETTAATIPLFEAALRRSIYRLGVLLGGTPGSMVEELVSAKAQPVAPPTVPVGLPSDLVRRRPDVRRAERELAAATARIGVAVADLYPRFSLTARVGSSALEAEELFKGKGGLWSLGPSLDWPIFTAGKIRGNIAVQNARQEQAALRFEKSIYLALEDVEGSLISFGQEQKRYASLTRSVNATRRASSLANDRYKAGLENFLTVLEADRQLLLAEESQVLSQTQVSLDLVRLYKALGGGWGETRVKK
jgi:NodT family efflux transporter outer membrane factor (OMF) lipoprotein